MAHSTQSKDTYRIEMNDIKAAACEIDRSRIRAARAGNPADKLLAGPRLFDRVRLVMLSGIRAQYPSATTEQVRAMLADRLALSQRLEDARDE